MLRSSLRYIRQKPKAVRNQYALGISIFFTSVVALVWLISNPSLLGRADTAVDMEEAKVNNPPFANLLKQAKEQWASVRNALPAAETAPAETTAAVGEMTLSPETLSDSASAALNTPVWQPEATTTTTTSPVVQYQEIRIATTSSTATASTTVTP